MSRIFPLAVLVILGFALAGADSPPAAPNGVVAVSTPDHMLVAWTPSASSTVEVVTYHVYGRLGSSPVHLVSVPGDATQYEAPYGYTAYGVSARVGVQESDISWSGDCIYTDLREIPPDIAINHYCGKAHTALKVRTL